MNNTTTRSINPFNSDYQVLVLSILSKLLEQAEGYDERSYRAKDFGNTEDYHYYKGMATAYRDAYVDLLDKYYTHMW